MTPVNACTVITRNRLAHARVLARSFLEHHPDGAIAALVVDDVDRDVGRETFAVVHPDETGLELAEFHRMATLYTPYELCNALKPWAIESVRRRGATEVLYLDSDMRVYHELGDVIDLADTHGLVLTPHLLAPPERPPTPGEEEARFVGGIYNAGFLAVGTRGARFLEWWRERLARDCLLAPEEGYWTDQRWLDLVPGYFPHHQLRDPGSNVAPWNVAQRRVESGDGGYLVDGAPLRTFHFALYDPCRPHLASRYVSPRFSEHPSLRPLYAAYREELMESGYRDCVELPIALGRLPNGLEIDAAMRFAYRAALLDAERAGRAEPPNPFADGTDAFIEWLQAPGRSFHRSRYVEAADSVPGFDRAEAPADLLATPRPAPARGPHPTSPVRRGVTVVLRLEPRSTLDAAGRELAAALEGAGVDHEIVWWDDEARTPDRVFPSLHPAQASFGSTLICLNPVDLGSFAFHVPGEAIASRFTVGLWMDEECPAPDLAHALSFLDEVWVASSFAAEALRRATEREVQVLPIPLAVPVTPGRPSGLSSPERFTYLTIGDLGENRDRFEEANPLATIRAFCRAFPEPGEASLLVRTTNGHLHLDRLEELRFEADRPDVQVVDGPLRPEERIVLACACDCYVSLHRAEEVSFTSLAALAQGRPAFVTGFSGNLPELPEAAPFLVRYEEIARTEPAKSWWEGTTWAEPHVDHAAELLRWARDSPADARIAARTAAEALGRRHHPAAAAAFVADRLSAGSPRRKPLAVPSSGPPPLEHAVGYLLSGPSNPWDARSRLGPAGLLLRKASLRLIRPYAIRRHELDEAVVGSLADLNHRVRALEERADPATPRDDARPSDE